MSVAPGAVSHLPYWSTIVPSAALRRALGTGSKRIKKMEFSMFVLDQPPPPQKKGKKRRKI
jgi:hypothetical protein